MADDIRILGFVQNSAKLEGDPKTNAYLVDKILAKVEEKGDFLLLTRPVVVSKDIDDTRQVEIFSPEDDNGKKTITEHITKPTHLVVDYTEKLQDTLMVKKGNFTGVNLKCEFYDAELRQYYIDNILNVEQSELSKLNLPLYNVNRVLQWKPKPQIFDNLAKKPLTAESYIIIEFSNTAKRAFKVKEVDETKQIVYLVLDGSDVQLFTEHKIVNMRRKD